MRRRSLDASDNLTLDELFEEGGPSSALGEGSGGAEPSGLAEDVLDMLMGASEPLGERPSDDLALMPQVLVRSLSAVPTAGWPYNPRSDRHSVVKCWGFLLDLVRACPLVGERLVSGEYVFGINSVVDGKALDLVVGRPGVWGGGRRPRAFGGYVESHGIALSGSDRAALQPYAGMLEGVVASPILAVEAKAVMTDHGGALPRLTDELSRFGARDVGIRVGLLMVNVSGRFVSPGRQGGVNGVVETRHRQPHAALSVVDAVSRVSGYTGMGMVFVDCPNDGPVRAVDVPGCPGVEYGGMVRRVAAEVSSLM